MKYIFQNKNTVYFSSSQSKKQSNLTSLYKQMAKPEVEGIIKRKIFLRAAKDS